MSLTRDERAVIENMIKRLDKFEERAFDIEARLDILEPWVKKLAERKVLEDYTDTELVALINFSSAVKKLINKTAVKLHNHKSTEAGGKAFAELGATLIDTTNIENEEPEA